MKILVTGGTGFIGNYLVKELRKKNHKVHILTIDKTFKDKNLIIADVMNRKKVLDIVPSFDVVYHLAGVLGTSELIPKAYEASEINILGSINILDGAVKNKTKVINITKPNCWLNTYSITKYASESFAKMYYKEMGLPTVSLRWFNVYGPGQSFHCQKAVPFFIRWAIRNEPIQIWGNGKQTMDLMYATDAVNASIVVAENEKLNGTTVEIGTGLETTVNQLAKLVLEETRSKSKIVYLPMRPGETPNTRLKADTKVLKKLGFKAKVNLTQGIKETIRWYKKNL